LMEAHSWLPLKRKKFSGYLICCGYARGSKRTHDVGQGQHNTAAPLRRA
jgi:hypothetical protein